MNSYSVLICWKFSYDHAFATVIRADKMNYPFSSCGRLLLVPGGGRENQNRGDNLQTRHRLDLVLVVLGPVIEIETSPWCTQKWIQRVGSNRIMFPIVQSDCSLVVERIVPSTFGGEFITWVNSIVVFVTYCSSLYCSKFYIV